jgi:hypothetical protein
VLLIIVFTQLVLTISTISVSTVFSLPCVSHECSLPVLLTFACEFQCECCKGVRFPDRCSVDKLFPRACTASSSYSAVPWDTCQLCTVCCLTAAATTWSQWVFTSPQHSRVCRVLGLVCLHMYREKHAVPVSAIRMYGRAKWLFQLFLTLAQLWWAVSQLHAVAALPFGKALLYPLTRRLGGPQTWSRWFLGWW